MRVTRRWVLLVLRNARGELTEALFLEMSTLIADGVTSGGR